MCPPVLGQFAQNVWNRVLTTASEVSIRKGATADESLREGEKAVAATHCNPFEPTLLSKAYNSQQQQRPVATNISPHTNHLTPTPKTSLYQFLCLSPLNPPPHLHTSPLPDNPIPLLPRRRSLRRRINRIPTSHRLITAIGLLQFNSRLLSTKIPLVRTLMSISRSIPIVSRIAGLSVRRRALRSSVLWSWRAGVLCGSVAGRYVAASPAGEAVGVLAGAAATAGCNAAGGSGLACCWRG